MLFEKRTLTISQPSSCSATVAKLSIALRRKSLTDLNSVENRRIVSLHC